MFSMPSQRERSSGKMTSTFNPRNYIALLERDEIAPKIIETAAEYDQFLAIVERLIFKKQERTTEESTLLKLLVHLIKDYEEQVFDLENWSKTSPHELLQFLMEAKGIKQADLVGVLSDSSGLVSLIVNGKRAISKAQAKKLGEFFYIEPSVFI
jgi:HTH-type transcriptional regulator / antitoxin HigA